MEKILTQTLVSEVFQAMPHLLRFPSSKFWVDYDDEADVLYISFQRPQKATDSQMMSNGALLRYRKKELVGITILDASKRSKNLYSLSKDKTTSKHAAVQEPSQKYKRSRKKN